MLTSGARHNRVGGVLLNEANVIANSSASGISVAAALLNTNNTIRGNAIFANGTLGIDLGATGVTVNDANDTDTGANGLQNFPTLSLATSNSPTEVKLTGSLASAANTTYAVDFYANANLDLSGHGEGEFYLGSINLTTDGSGLAQFTTTFTAPLPGRYLSATATDPFGNTGEFSRWVVISASPLTNLSGGADFVFIIDASSSMGGEIAAVKNGLGNFVSSLDTSEVDARFAVVLFGGAPEIIQDFTTDQAITEAAFDLISVSGAVLGVHNDHNANPEAGLEAIRIVLNSAGTNFIFRNNVGGAGPLVFRPDARKNLILVTDENSDLPFYVTNRMAGQTGTEPPSVLTAPWQAEVDATAQAVIANNAFVNLLINPAATPSRNQYGDPTSSVSNTNFLNFNPAATLTNLINAGYGSSLEAQVLAAGLVGRSFNITSVNTTNFIANFFAAKVEEIVFNPIPPAATEHCVPPTGCGPIDLAHELLQLPAGNQSRADTH
ncbi:MAG: VWA domain-containing protein [Verrucomicrobiota bacterium]